LTELVQPLLHVPPSPLAADGACASTVIRTATRFWNTRRPATPSATSSRTCPPDPAPARRAAAARDHRRSRGQGGTCGRMA